MFSNLKGLFLGVPMPLVSISIGQWSEPLKGRITVIISLSKSMRSSEIMNLSNLEATWEFPPLLLFQVQRPLFVSISTSFMFSEKFWKAATSLFRALVPPFFSERDLIMLKSPPMTQGNFAYLTQRYTKESKNLILSSNL